MNNLLPRVHRKEGWENFNSKKILQSLLKETTLSEVQARKVCEATVRRIISNKIDFLTGPHIREICCSILAEKGYSQIRLSYTRVGFPYYELKKILKTQNPKDLIYNHVVQEFEAVNRRMEELEK